MSLFLLLIDVLTLSVWRCHLLLIAYVGSKHGDIQCGVGKVHHNRVSAKPAAALQCHRLSVNGGSECSKLLLSHAPTIAFGGAFVSSSSLEGWDRGATFRDFRLVWLFLCVAMVFATTLAQPLHCQKVVVAGNHGCSLAGTGRNNVPPVEAKTAKVDLRW
eukprot:983288-Amphidinium_carterae.1